MLTRQLVAFLPLGTILHHHVLRGSDNQPLRCRVNGRCKVWKTRPDDFQLPVKHGLYTYFYIAPANADDWTLPQKAS